MARSTPDPNRRILAIALPALVALLAEPLYVLVDTAIVGHLGVRPLAALALAGAVIASVTTLCNFLEYGSTPQVGRLFAIGDERAAAHLGRQAGILAVAIGIVSGAVAFAVAPPVLSGLGARGEVNVLAVRYMRISAAGLPFALVALAASGYFRGVTQLRTPLVVFVGGNVLNAVLEVVLVYVLHMGIAGSAWGTVVAQAVIAVVFAAIFRRGVAAGRRPSGPDTPYGPDGNWEGWPRIDLPLLRSLAGTGGQIFVRTAALYASFLLAGALLARIGTSSLAAHQVVFQLWGFLALALDALAIAAQVLVSHALGVKDDREARALAARTITLSFLTGILLAALLLALETPLQHIFTSSPRVLDRTHAVWPLFALMQPINGVAFALDGILLGAGDTRFLMWAMAPCSLLVFAPLLLAAYLAHWGIVGIWAALYAFVAARALVTGWRFLGGRWLRSAAGARATA